MRVRASLVPHRNVGYLFAIAHGARRIFDFDDDNQVRARITHIIPMR